ncbi:hypothetical protein BV898_08488 [Hypsibius exemplaris]|uniref:G-protein coupled receptors family 1 profile domain-containing protein n=1 Tax=Hypsibius exemplaris TaxID=2072580 RepID=A0A1W0WQF3_HYPEX|nr:hypothetical protein BV898_08488 [Hypsibius exemplaris]
MTILIFHYVATNLFYEPHQHSHRHLPHSNRRDGHSIPANICNAIQVIYMTGAGVINWAEVALAANRCIALFLPHSYKVFTTKAINFLVIILAWVISLASCLPLSFGVGGVFRLLPLGQCMYMPEGRLGDFMAALFSFVPYSFAGVGALMILCRSYDMSKVRVEAVKGAREKAQLRRLKMAKILLLTFLLSAVCPTPWGVLANNFPMTFLTNPVSVLWLRTAMACQYAFTPVRLNCL